MDPLRRDIQYLNQKVLLLAVQQANAPKARRTLGANSAVWKLLKDCSSEACRSAVNCNAPLAVFRPDALLPLRRVMQRVSTERPDELTVEVNELTLHLAQRILSINVAAATLLFALNPDGIEVLEETSWADLSQHASRRADIVQLRCCQDAMFWDRVLIGRRVEGARGHRICQNTALLSMKGGGVSQWGT